MPSYIYISQLENSNYYISKEKSKDVINYFECRDCNFIDYVLRLKLKRYEENDSYNISYDELISIIEEIINQDNEDNLFEIEHFERITFRLEKDLKEYSKIKYNKIYYSNNILSHINELRKQLILIEDMLLTKKDIDEEKVIEFIKINTIMSNEKVDKKILYDLFKDPKIELRDFNQVVRKHFNFKEKNINNVSYWIGISITDPTINFYS